MERGGGGGGPDSKVEEEEVGIGTEKARQASPMRDGISHLPDADDGVGDQDEQDHKRLHEGRDRVVVVLKEGQNLERKAVQMLSLLLSVTARIYYFSPFQFTIFSTQSKGN